MLKKLIEEFEHSFTLEFIRSAQENDLSTRAASLALFSVMSVFPFIALLVWVSTLSGTPEEARLWATRFGLFLPPDFADLIKQEVDYRLQQELTGSLISILMHVALIIISAGGAIRSFLFSLRDIAKAEDVIGFHQIIFRSLLLIIPATFAVFLASIVVAFVSFVSNQISSALNSAWLSIPLIWLMMTGVFITILNAVYASSLIGHQTVRIHGWAGSITAASMISIVTIVISAYYQLHPTYREWYGTPGFIITVLLWFYLCSTGLLMGAQINAVRHIRKRRAAEEAKHTAEGSGEPA